MPRTASQCRVSCPFVARPVTGSRLACALGKMHRGVYLVLMVVLVSFPAGLSAQDGCLIRTG